MERIESSNSDPKTQEQPQVSEVAAGNEPETSGTEHVNGADQSPIALAEKTLAGDLRDGVWKFLQDYGLLLKRSEADQRRVADGLLDLAQGFAKAGVHLIAAREFPAITCLLKEGKIKDNTIEAKVAISRYDPNRHALLDTSGGEVLLILADARLYQGTRGAIRIEPDEPALPLEEKPAAPQGDLELGTAADRPDEPAEHTEAESPAYAEGAEDRLADKAWDCNPFAAGARAYARYIAGWLDQEIAGLGETPKQQKLAKTQAHKHFREMGRDDALEGKLEEANPFPIGWRYRDSWAEGWIAGRDAAAALAASDAVAAAPNGEAPAP